MGSSQPNTLPTRAPRPEKRKWEAVTQAEARSSLVCLSVGKTLQLQVFVLWETCLDLFPESTQMLCWRQNHTTPHCTASLQPSACGVSWRLTLPVGAGGRSLPVFSGSEKRHPEERQEITFLPTSLAEEGQPS